MLKNSLLLLQMNKDNDVEREIQTLIVTAEDVVEYAKFKKDRMQKFATGVKELISIMTEY